MAKVKPDGHNPIVQKLSSEQESVPGGGRGGVRTGTKI